MRRHTLAPSFPAPAPHRTRRSSAVAASIQRHCADTTTSRAVVKEVALNWLATKATRWVVSRNSTSKPASTGSERAHSSVMRPTTPHLPQAPRRPYPRELATPSSPSSVFISMTLMDVYAKTSRLELVLQVLGEMPSRNVVSRTMLVASLIGTRADLRKMMDFGCLNERWRKSGTSGFKNTRSTKATMFLLGPDHTYALFSQ
ncbi:hypothetical protein ZEAMMB73_Zm00001d010883 [Zea mays]|uniref:Pentatricopeptide repeat-containing protein n=1 Tax=Zea mays TaxID=4577 RepID=A0A1D6FUM6_MAIZE|nr:hypothetical protein ZEAMMB73_Zm00001d010883 [Zea mays]